MSGNPLDALQNDALNQALERVSGAPGAPPNVPAYSPTESVPESGTPPSLAGQEPVPEVPPADLTEPGPLPPALMNQQPDFPVSNVGAPGAPQPSTSPDGPGPTAKDVFSNDMADYIDPDLLAQLKASASDDKMDVTTAITMAGLAAANPELLTQIMAHRESGKQNARSLLTQLQGQISTAKRTAMAAETSLNKAQLVADEAAKKQTYTSNATAVAQAAKQARAEGVVTDVLQPTGDALNDAEKVQTYLASVDGALGVKQKRVEEVNKNLAVIQNMVQKGVMDPKLVAPAMREVYKNAGYTDAEIDGKFSAQMMIAQSAAESMAKMKAAERARLGAVKASADMNVGLAIRKLEAMEEMVSVKKQQLSIQQQTEMRLALAELTQSVGKYTAWADTTEDPELQVSAAGLALDLTKRISTIQPRYEQVQVLNQSLGLERNKEMWLRKLTDAADMARDPSGAIRLARGQGLGLPDVGNDAAGNNRAQAAMDAIIYSNVIPDDIRYELLLDARTHVAGTK